MQGRPLPELDGKPPRIDTERNDAQQPPLDVVAEQLPPSPIKHHLLSVDDGVVSHPILPYADCPRKGKPQCETCKERNEDVGSYHPQQTSGEFRFVHFFSFLFCFIVKRQHLSKQKGVNVLPSLENHQNGVQSSKSSRKPKPKHAVPYHIYSAMSTSAMWKKKMRCDG